LYYPINKTTQEAHTMVDKLVLPLNEAGEEYSADFDKMSPPQINAYLSIFRIGADFPLPDDPREEQLLDGILDSEEVYLSRDPSKSGLVRSSQIILHTYATPEFPFLLEKMHAAESAWVCDDLFLDMAFLTNPEPSEDEKISAILGMRFLNHWHLTSGSIDPRDHVPLAIPSISPTNYEEIVGEAFASKTGLWTRELAVLQTRWLVFARAILQGRDPVTEWERFEATGSVLHFDYPRMCP
jgi:hypothetical protein